MAKFSLCIFTMAVLLGGTAADLMCIKKEEMAITPNHFITDPGTACRDLDTKFEKARQELKKCLDVEVDLSKLEALHREFCNPNSEFRRKVDRQRHCINGNLRNSKDCLQIMYNSRHRDLADFLRNPLYKKCRSLSVEASKCLADKVGGPCGAEGQEVYGRMMQAMKPLSTEMCFWGGKSAMRDNFLLEGFDEAWLSRDYDQHMIAAAAAHSALIWCILVGLLLASRWW